YRTERRGADRRQARTPGRVARDPVDTRDGCHMAFGAFFVKGKERGRVAGNHGESRPARSREGNLGLGKALLREGVEAIVPQAKEVVCGQMLATFGGNNGHAEPLAGAR